MLLVPNQAHYELEGADSGQQEIVIQGNEIGMLHAQFDNPEAEFDLVVSDRAGNEQLRRHVANPTKRWGERVDLPLADNYYIIKVENVKGAKVIDIFAD